MLNRMLFIKVILIKICKTTPHDWLKDLAPLFSSNQKQTQHHTCDLFARVFTEVHISDILFLPGSSFDWLTLLPVSSVTG